MPLYYFDLETTGLEPGINQIITVQFSKLSDELKPMTELMILKIWELGSERTLIERFLKESSFFDDPFTFVPIGNNVIFHITFLHKRCEYYGLSDRPLWKVLYNKPFIDLKPVLVIANKMRFTGYDSSIEDKMMIKSRDIPTLYSEGKYDDIIRHIYDKYKVVLGILQDACKLIASLHPEKV
jgi:hypothetical protein